MSFMWAVRATVTCDCPFGSLSNVAVAHCTCVSFLVDVKPITSLIVVDFDNTAKVILSCLVITELSLLFVTSDMQIYELIVIQICS